MAIYDDVSTGIKEAMRARDSVRLNALRNIRAVLLNKAKETGADTVGDEECVDLLRRLAKQRRESIDAFDGAGRTEQADAERAELAIVEGFLPSLADEATTRSWVQAAIEQAGASSPKEVGRVMGMVMKAHKGEVDGGLTRRIAEELLSG